jgi:hypothetical protein
VTVTDGVLVLVGVTDGDAGAQYEPQGSKSSPGKGPTGPDNLVGVGLAHMI